MLIVPELSDRQIHIWYIPLIKSLYSDKFFFHLTDYEKVKAKGFARDLLSEQYILCHGILNVLIKRYLGINLRNQLSFEFSSNEKPKLSNHLNTNYIQFNLSRSNNLAVVAFTRHHQIGVDIECKLPINGMDYVAKKILKNREYKNFVRLEEKKKQAIFYEIWVRKEAFAKAVGKGLCYPLEDIEISFCSDPDNSLYTLINHKEPTDEWRFHDVSVSYSNLNYVCICCAQSQNNYVMQINKEFEDNFHQSILIEP